MINVSTLHDPDHHLQEVTHDSVAYYIRQGEVPGRWAGSGATALGLAGEITLGPIHDLFDGKNPNTGEYQLEDVPVTDPLLHRRHQPGFVTPTTPCAGFGPLQVP